MPIPPPPPSAAQRFPDDFIFGCSSASYQIEGAWNRDGKYYTYNDRAYYISVYIAIRLVNNNILSINEFCGCE